MTPFTAAAVKLLGSGAAAAVLSMGVAGTLAQAATPSPSPATSTSTTDRHADRKLVRQAVLESEADVLGIPEGTLIADLKKGQKVSDLANDRHINKDEFAKKLAANLKPRLAQLVDHKQITQAQADRILDRISKGRIPFWDGIHRRK
ncbi:MAG: hypothetical protein E6I42_04765 [Chloroflexi bacterium]|nr:MAG: hypothetical protein E6J30_08055 [Chloroflexota bacterium]TMF05080.1 MAG: hypothetical protein E6I42_04765 [Chloroflexota bacterium]TMG27516.1 MAG: hypothetical protein E6H97_06495 [Chloroflexota bacterium]